MNLIITAFPHEYKLVESLMERVQKVSSFEARCSRQNQYYHILNAGQGRQNCLMSLDRIFGVPNKIEQVFCVGFCGGLSPELKVGDIVYPNQVAFLEGQNVQLIETSAGESCTLLTVVDPVQTSEEKKHMYNTLGFEAVDMEAYFIVQKCKSELSLSVQVIKCVMDDARQGLDQKDLLLHNIKFISPKFKTYLSENIL